MRNWQKQMMALAALTLWTVSTRAAEVVASLDKTKTKITAKPKSTAKPAVKNKAAAVRRVFTRRLPPTPPVSVATRKEAQEGVVEKVASGQQFPFENSRALVPLFEQLYRHQSGELPGSIHLLHYGDSHAAADELTGGLREHFQQAFGDGGPGYSYAGRPWNSYRRLDVRSSSTHGWYSNGLVGRTGDGMYGLGGVAMSAMRPHEAVTLDAEGQSFELYYLRQPGGGQIAIFDNGMMVERVDTSGETAPAYFPYNAEYGPHKLEVKTLDSAPVRLFGWTAEKATGVTYETLGINGAEAQMMLGWNETVLRSNIEHRNPALIVLAFGTNEAGRRDLTLESYREQFVRIVARLREAAPAASILIVGPPDREIYARTPATRKSNWVEMDSMDMVIEAQRQAALASGCAFWDQREKMGGKGAMNQWVQAGFAQYDHVHFTVPGYHMLADAIYRDLMTEYAVFLKARESMARAAPPVAAKTVAEPQ